jgi:hypothetical protein
MTILAMADSLPDPSGGRIEKIKVVARRRKSIRQEQSTTDTSRAAIAADAELHAMTTE